MSATLLEIPSQPDIETLQGPALETGARNGTSGEFMAFSQSMSGNNTTYTLGAYNLTSNTTYQINHTYSGYGAWNGLGFTPQGNTSWVFSIDYSGLNTGCYNFTALMWEQSTWTLIQNSTWTFAINMNLTDCFGSPPPPGGNNSSEWLMSWTNSQIHNSSNAIDLNWSAGSLATNNITYNVSVDVYGVVNNNTTIVWSNSITFSPTSNSTFGTFLIPPNTLSLGCYYASFGISDDNSGLLFDYDGFNFDVDFDCSTIGGNNTGGNNSYEWLMGWTNSQIYNSSNTIDLNWSAGSLATNNITYNVSVDVYGMVNNNTTVVWSDSISFSPTSNSTSGTFQIPPNTLSLGCYYASFELSDNDDGMVFDYDGVNFDVDVDCSSNGGNNTGGPGINAWPYDGFTGNDILDYQLNNTDAIETNVWGNTVNSSNYTLGVWITDENGVPVHNFTEDGPWVMEGFNVHFVPGMGNGINMTGVGLGDGCYDFHATLTEGSILWEYETWPFTINTNFTDCYNTGGNNTGGNNNTDCGTNNSFTSVMSWTDSSSYIQGTDPFGSFYVNCTVIGTNYTLEYHVYDISNGNISWAGTWSWIAQSNYSSFSESFLGLTEGDYCMVADLYNLSSPSPFVVDDGGQTCFQILANNTSGNNSGGNNNNTHGAMFVYIQSGTYGFGISEQLPLSLHFPAPPMANNSPYEMSQICSVDSGHTVDVFSTWVYSEGGNAGDFNNITSWSVNNDNGLQLDHFSYDPMFDIIGFANPMVVFEDDANWSGHISAEVFDQAAWTCVNSTPSGNNTVTNTAPIVSNVSISPSQPTSTVALNCQYAVYDAEGDTTVATVTWSVNGTVVLNGSDDLSSGFAAGDEVTCSVSANDGQETSNIGSDSVIIQAESPAEEDDDNAGFLPSLGAIGTMAAIAVGVFASRRKNE